MAANYWNSTQAIYWTFTKSELTDIRKQVADANQHMHSKYPIPDHRLMNIWMQQNLIRLAKRMGLRQQALATAQAYIKRFYLVVETRKTNPYLIMTTAVYLACKMEECPQHIRLMLGEAARQWPELGVNESGKIGECEFAMISTLNSRLIVHHPYRSLGDLAPLFGLSTEEQGLAHSVVNDSYNTDLLLLYPPHIIALAAIFVAVVLRPTGLQSFQSAANPHLAHPLQVPVHRNGGALSSSTAGGPALSASAAQNAMMGGLQASLKQVGPKLGRLVDWLAESKIDMAALVDATQEMVSLFEVWEHYNEKTCREAVAKFRGGSNK